MASRRQQAERAIDAAAAATPAVAADASDSEALVVFQLAGAAFALRLAEVAEIIRPPALTYMPLVHPSLRGLSNLRGAVLPVVSLSALLDLPDAGTTALTRVIVMRGDAAVGFVVDHVERLMTTAAGALERDEAAAGPNDAARTDGLIKGGEGDSAIRLLNPQRLLSGRFARLGAAAGRTASLAATATGMANAAPAQILVSLLSFHLDQQEYALPLEHVREIIRLPAHVVAVPRPEDAVLGVMTLRDCLLPLVSLRSLLGLAEDSAGALRRKVLVVPLGAGMVGVVVDATREILRVAPDLIERAPALLTRGEGDAEISSICRLDGGRRLIALLSPDRLFRSEVVGRILAEHGSTGDQDLQEEATTMADEQFIIFRLANQDYGVPIAAVGEIARPPKHITRLPNAPAFVDGVINLRGAVVPVVDLRRRFEVSASANTGTQRILILSIGGGVAGFLVDGVSEILSVDADAVQPAPELSPAQMRLISRVVNLEAKGRMIPLVDPTQLLDQVEADVLSQFNRSDLTKPVTAP